MNSTHQIMNESPTFKPIILTQQQFDDYDRDGLLIVPDVLTAQEVDRFVEDQSRPKPQEMRAGLRTHTVDPMWKYVAHHANIAGVASQLLGGAPKIVQTMYMAKAPAEPNGEKGGRGIALHQDTHYLPSEPNTLMACWIAMSDTDAGNGGLCVVPGSHKGQLRNAQLNKDEDHLSWETEHLMRDRHGKEWKQKMFSFQIDDLKDDEIVRLTVPQGHGVFFTGMTIHGSFANRSPYRRRLAFAVHYIHEDTWLLRADVQETVPVTRYSEVGA